MPSACRMPSIFGPTPEISLRSSTGCRLVDAGRAVRVVERRLGRLCRSACRRRHRLAAQHSGEAGSAFGLADGDCAVSTPSRPRLRPCSRWRRRMRRRRRSRPSRPQARPCPPTATSAPALVSGASVFGLAALDGGTACRRRHWRRDGASAPPGGRRRGLGFLVARRLQDRLLVASARSGRLSARRRCGRSAARAAPRRPCRRRKRR